MSNLFAQIISGQSASGLTPFVDINGFHLNAPSWLSDGDIVDWEVLVNMDFTNSGWFYQFPTSKYFVVEEGSVYLVAGNAISQRGSNTAALQKVAPTPTTTVFWGISILDKIHHIQKVTTRAEVQRFSPSYSDIITITDFMVLNLSKLGLSEVIDSNLLAQEFGYESASDMPSFPMEFNGTLMAKGGKLYYAN